MYTQRYDNSNRFVGVTNTVAVGGIPPGSSIPANPDNSHYKAFLQWNAQQPVPLSLADLAPPVKRMLRQATAIVDDLVALTTGQKTAIWTDLTAGSPPKLLVNAGEYKPALEELRLRARSSLYTAQQMTEMKLFAAALYCLANPTYLVNPSFDSTINVSVDQVAP
ncbi:MAG: hypothetical protein K2R98_19510 [Gemmataceae bacterium]|nr:hypothetical protein [Gemmataceae bacterium]